MGNDNTGAQGQTPPAQGQTPPAQGQTPPAQGQTPPAQGQTPPAQGQTPPAQGQTPPAQGQTPPAQNSDSSTTQTPPGMPGGQTQQSLRAPEGTPQNIIDWAVSSGLNQAQFDTAIQQYQTVIASQAEATKAELRQAGEAKLQEWGDQAQKHLATAKAALKTYDKTGELSKLLTESGYGNHPAVLQFFKDLGETLNEGDFIPGRPISRAKKLSAAEKMFPSMKK